MYAYCSVQYVRLWNKPFLFYLKTVGGGFVAASGPVRLGKTIDMHGHSVASPFFTSSQNGPLDGPHDFTIN
jgi:hypothetical protein